MIQPINSSLNTNNLEPVKVPHFAGLKKQPLTESKDTTNFKNKAKKTVKTGKSFLKEFFNSLFSDTKKIFEKKSENTVQKMDNIGNIAEVMQ